MTRLSTSPVNNVNSVQFSRSVSVSHSLFPVPVTVVASSTLVSLASSRPQGLPAQTPLSSTCLVANTFQDLVPPSRVTPIDAHKLWRELCFHPDQVKVDYVISGLTNGFRLGFDPSAVSLQSAAHNMPSASLQPSVIDQYLLTEREKGRVAGPFLISPIPNLHVSRFGVKKKKKQRILAEAYGFPEVRLRSRSGELDLSDVRRSIEVGSYNVRSGTIAYGESFYM